MDGLDKDSTNIARVKTDNHAPTGAGPLSADRFIVDILRRLFRRLPPWIKEPIRKNRTAFYRHLLPPSAIEYRLPPSTIEYSDWIVRYDKLSHHDRSQILARIQTMSNRPLISIVMPVYETPANDLREAIESVFQQIYDRWELCIADDASPSPHVRKMLESYARKDARVKCIYRETNGHISNASNSALTLASGEYIALMDHDDVLPAHALYMVAEAILEHPSADIFYSDEDKLDSDGKRTDPYFKPDWNPELFYGQNFLNHLTVYRRSKVTDVGGFRIGYEGSQDYDLALRMVASTQGPIIHIPHVLYHWRIFSGAATMSSTNHDTAVKAARRALMEHFDSTGETVEVEDVLGRFNRILRKDPEPWPKVSVIIPTRDYLNILQVAVSGLLEKTDYPDLEIIIADNESVESRTLTYLETLKAAGIKIVSCPGPFNYSRINNQAITQATGELILLLNNDISMIDTHWLKEMVRYFSDSSVGVVGAKLLYPDGTLQHAGVALGIGGVAGHQYVGSAGDEPGAFGWLALPHEVACVTAACLLIRRSLFNSIGKLDEINLPVAFNDVDLCLRVRQAGYRIIWTPYAILHHHESKSRGSDMTGDKYERFRREACWMKEKWGEKLLVDPFYNPNLSLRTTKPTLATPPRSRKPWQQ